MTLVLLKVIETAFRCFAARDTMHTRKSYKRMPGLKLASVSASERGRWVENEFGAYALFIGSTPAFQPSLECYPAALKIKDFGAAKDHLKEERVKSRMAREELPSSAQRRF